MEQLSHVDDLVEGDIYIGCGETEGMAEVIRTIRPLHRSYPRIRVHLTSGNAELVTDRLEKELLDFALLCRSVPPMEYVHRKLSHSSEAAFL